jgi:hypothetical protein
MIRTAIKLAALTVLFLPLLMAADESLRSLGLWNGRAWLSWDTHMRLGYLFGYRDHLRVTTDALKTAKDWEDETTWWPNLTYGQTAKALDTFYAVPENGNIPIRGALHIVAERVLGKWEGEVEKDIERLRKIALGK